jgi:hypothetical protein
VDQLLVALAPGFAVGFAVQRLLEILDAVLGFVLGDRWDKSPTLKHFALSVVSIIAGATVALTTGIRVLHPLGGTASDGWDVAVTALVISAGTEGLNSILKYLGYKKDEQKAETKAAGITAAGTTG